MIKLSKLKLVLYVVFYLILVCSAAIEFLFSLLIILFRWSAR